MLFGYLDSWDIFSWSGETLISIIKSSCNITSIFLVVFMSLSIDVYTFSLLDLGNGGG